MKTFQMNLPGYDSSRDDTDDLVIWVNAPSMEAAKLFAKKRGAEIESIEELFHPWKMTMKDGVDHYINERGEIE